MCRLIILCRCLPLVNGLVRSTRQTQLTLHVDLTEAVFLADLLAVLIDCWREHTVKALNWGIAATTELRHYANVVTDLPSFIATARKIEWTVGD